MLGRLLRHIVGDAVFQMAVALLIVWGTVQLVERFDPSGWMVAEHDESRPIYSPPLVPEQPTMAAPLGLGLGQLVAASPSGMDGLY